MALHNVGKNAQEGQLEKGLGEHFLRGHAGLLRLGCVIQGTLMSALPAPGECRLNLKAASYSTLLVYNNSAYLFTCQGNLTPH